MKILFDIKYKSQIESGEYKVETRDGRPVEILKWNAKAKDGACIIASIEEDGEEEAYQFFPNGSAVSSKSSDEYCADLFIITPEPELSEWETFISGCLQKHGLLDCGAADRIAQNCSAELLELARKELVKEGTSKNEMGTMLYDAGFEDGKEEALKDLPRWKKATYKKSLNDRAIVLTGENDLLCTNFTVEGDYYLFFSELKKLPKED